MKHLFAILSLFLLTSLARASDLTLWYTHPATDWQSECLPIGNGRLGAMIFGDPQHEHIQLNESSLWTGDEKDTGKYQNLGDLSIDFTHGPATNYHRSLDLNTAIHTIEYDADQTHFTREYFASHPANILMLHFTASNAASFTGSLKFTDAHNAKPQLESKTSTINMGQPITSSFATLTAEGKLDNALVYGTYITIDALEGSVTIDGDTLKFANCNELIILVNAATNYSNDHSKNWRTDAPKDRALKQLYAAVATSVDDLRAAHLVDYQSLFNRMTLNLGITPSEITKRTTDERLAAYTKGQSAPELESLLYQYGRYLLISSSRDALPANLHGLWNNSNNPPWRCDYHSNINIEMNYWPAEVANLSECTAPLFTYINSLRAVRTEATHDYYLNQVDPKIVERKSVRGWTVQTENGVFGGSSWKWNPPASAWYCLHLWEHYAFTQDKQFLAVTAYPIMKEISQFWEDHLVALPDGTLVTPDGWSPEHGPLEKGVSYDQEIIYNLFTNFIEASKTLDIDPDERTKISAMRDKLLQSKIGKWGQLQEWMEDRDDPKDNHRHISHLFALYPGDQIFPLTTPDLAAAAKISLTARTDESTGWAMAWRAICWARLLDADHAYKLLHNFIHLIPGNAPKNMVNGGGVYANLLCAHPPFQIDGNFGYTAAISEMLLQSQSNSLHLLPALPAAWPTGNIHGLLARGNIEVDLTWTNNKLTTATLHTPTATTCTIRYANQTTTILLPANQPVTLNANLQPISN